MDRYSEFADRLLLFNTLPAHRVDIETDFNVKLIGKLL